ncbi:MAG: molybdopterin-containing oxidoreductase family protein [Acidimicrobiales bacterium]
MPPTSRSPSTKQQHQVRGFCPLDCPDTCSWVVTVEDGRPVKLHGDRSHPYTKGGLCVKVNGFLDHAADPTRLHHPLRRVGAKGEGRFERISWDEALDEIASRWKETIKRTGPEAIWPYYGTGTMGILQGLAGAGRRLANVLGTSQHQVTVCTIAGGYGTGYTLGHNQVGMDPEMLSESKLIILWGTNTLSTNRHLWPTIRAARKDGAELVVIDPVRTRTAEQADVHLAPVPGTDAALALGLLNVVVSEGAEDREFIERHTEGWPQFRERILEFPPARVAAITGLDENEIRQLGLKLAAKRPTGIRLMMGVQRHGGGGMAVRTIACIPGVTGDWRYPGGGAGYDTRGFFGGNWNALWRDDLRPEGTRQLSMTRLGEGLLDLTDPPVEQLLIYGSNPVASIPDQRKVRAGLEREDLFTVVLEHFHTDTTAYADIVLPSTMQTEHHDLQHSYGHMYLAWNEPAAAPQGEALPQTEFFRRLARALGLTEPCLYDSDDDLAGAVLDSDHRSLDGIDLDYLKANGWARLNYPEKFAPFAEGFMTPSGKLAFDSAPMAELGLDPLAGFTPPHEAAQTDTQLAETYPLALIAAASHNFLNSTFANSESHRAREGELPIVVHPGDAASRGLKTGDHAIVFNERGQFEATVEVSERVRPGVAASVKGHWPSHVTGNANPNITVAERDADMGGGAVFHDNRVEVTRRPEQQRESP